MLWRVICVLLNHKADLDFGVKILLDDTRWNRFGVRACRRCGNVYIAFHRTQTEKERQLDTPQRGFDE